MTALARSRERRAAIAVCAGVALLAASLAYWWSTTNRYRLTGDEPHYFILAASLLRDGDLDVRNNFDEENATGEIYGPLPDRHIEERNGRQYSLHTPGLGALLAIPFALGGTLASRLLLALLIPSILGWACWCWFRDRAPPGDVALAIAGVLLCPAVLFGSGQVYPDLLAGAILFALAVWLWNGSTRTLVTWALWWLVAGGFIWLHIRFLGTAVVLALLGAWQLFRDRPRSDEDKGSRQPHAATAVLFLVGAGAFVWFQLRRLRRPVRRAAERSKQIGLSRSGVLHCLAPRSVERGVLHAATAAGRTRRTRLDGVPTASADNPVALALRVTRRPTGHAGPLGRRAGGAIQLDVDVALADSNRSLA